MKIEKFEDLIAWQKAKELTNKLDAVTKNCKEPIFREMALKITVSIMNHVAEGFEKRIGKEVRPTLLIAKGISSHARSMLYLLLDIGAITQEQFKEFYDISWHITNSLMAFVKASKAADEKREAKATP